MAGYYIKADGDDKGPYDAKLIRTSVREELLSKDALVRKEGEEIYRPLREVPGLLPKPPSTEQILRAYGPPESARVVDPGSFAMGFAISFFTGCIGLIVLRNARHETRRGSVYGFVAQIVLGVLIRLASFG